VDPEVEPRKKMTVTIDVSPEIEKKLHALAAQAGQSVEKYLQQLVESKALGENSPTRAQETYLDTEFLQRCAGEADASVTLEGVRQALSKIPGSMTADFMAERDEP
jgi:hypothetical protein